MSKFDLSNQLISDTFGNLLQKTGSDNNLYDLKGNPIIDLTISGSLIEDMPKKADFFKDILFFDKALTAAEILLI